MVKEEEEMRYAFMKMGEGWKSKRNRLFKKMEGDGTKTLEELIASVPDEVPFADMWERFVRYRTSDEGRVSKIFLKICLENESA